MEAFDDLYIQLGLDIFPHPAIELINYYLITLIREKDERFDKKQFITFHQKWERLKRFARDDESDDESEDEYLLDNYNEKDAERKIGYVADHVRYVKIPKPLTGELLVYALNFNMRNIMLGRAVL